MTGWTRRAAAATWLALAAAAVSAEPPAVTRVEPPSWWPGHSLDPVRVMLRGRGLAGARLETPAGLSASRVAVNGAGTTLFADVRARRSSCSPPSRARDGSRASRPTT